MNPGKKNEIMFLNYGGKKWSKPFTITSYCSGSCCCDKYADGFTATGKEARAINRIVAVDPNVIPLHSMVYIEGLGIFYAEDVGGMIKGRHIDILMDNHTKALKFGVQKRMVTVITTGYVSTINR
ncbi:MAG: 3D domain-containing protein [Candidatus Scalinduaceae bacterium]